MYWLSASSGHLGTGAGFPDPQVPPWFTLARDRPVPAGALRLGAWVWGVGGWCLSLPAPGLQLPDPSNSLLDAPPLSWLFWTLPASAFRVVTCLWSRDRHDCHSTAAAPASFCLCCPQRLLGGGPSSLSGVRVSRCRSGLRTGRSGPDSAVAPAPRTASSLPSLTRCRVRWVCEVRPPSGCFVWGSCPSGATPAVFQLPWCALVPPLRPLLPLRFWVPGFFPFRPSLGLRGCRASPAGARREGRGGERTGA